MLVFHYHNHNMNFITVVLSIMLGWLQTRWTAKGRQGRALAVAMAIHNSNAQTHKSAIVTMIWSCHAVSISYSQFVLLSLSLSPLPSLSPHPHPPLPFSTFSSSVQLPSNPSLTSAFVASKRDQPPEGNPSLCAFSMDNQLHGTPLQSSVCAQEPRGNNQ